MIHAWRGAPAAEAEKLKAMEAGREAPPPRPPSRLVTLLTICAFLALNSSLNMVNRWLLGPSYGFKFPIFLTMAHLVQGFFLLMPVMVLPQFITLHRRTLSQHWRGISAVACFKVANIVLNNMSLVYISLTLNQIIRSAIPVVTAMLGVVVERKVPTRFEFLSLLVLTSGVILSVWEGSIAGSAFGVGIAITSVFSGAAMLNFSGAVLKERLDVFRLTCYTAPVATAVLLPSFWVKESARLSVWWQESGGVETVVYLFLGGINAVLYNTIHYRVIQITSATATPVIGTIKVIGVVVLSAVFLGEYSIFTVRMVLGCALAMAGFGAYSWSQVGKGSSKGGGAAPPEPRGLQKGGGGGGAGFEAGQLPNGLDLEEKAALLRTIGSK